MDVFSRKIVGWSSAAIWAPSWWPMPWAWPSPAAQPRAGTIHHSDRGSQYTSVRMGSTLSAFGITASMGSKGDPHDNAACESAIGTIKAELVERHVFETRDVARLRIFDYIEAFYNPIRMHSTNNDLSPDEYEAAYHRTAAAEPAAA